MTFDRRVPAATLQRQLGRWKDAGSGTLGQSIAEQIRQLVIDGRLPVHVKLPAERELAMELGLSRTTIAGVYSRLRESGFIESKRGSGSWTAIPASATSVATPWMPGAPEATIDFSHAALEGAEPYLSDAVAKASGDLPRYTSSHGYHVYGLPVLRAAVAQRFTDRGLPTSADEIVITSGAQQAINLVLEASVQATARVMVDHPTYPGALDAIRRRNARAVPVGFDETVWDIEAMRETVRHAAPQLMYVSPDNHNPTGLSLPVGDRPAVVELAERSALPVIVDEALSELVLEGEDVHPLASFGTTRHSTLFTVGSASKLFWGGLRVGWIRAPRPVITRLANARAQLDMASPVFEQLVVANLLGQVEEIRELRRRSLLQSRDALMSDIALCMPTWTVHKPTGGLNLWVDLGAPLANVLCIAAMQAGIQITPGSRFGVDGAFENFIRLPFTLDVPTARSGIERLQQLWESTRTQQVRPSAISTAV